MNKPDNIITTVIVLILSTSVSNAQSKAVASLESPITILRETALTTDSTTQTFQAIGVYLVPSTVAAVTPATFHMKEAAGYLSKTVLFGKVDDQKTASNKQALSTNLLVANTAKP
jgi:hypothetical protein